jgi:hypothetical protein
MATHRWADGARWLLLARLALQVWGASWMDGGRKRRKPQASQ